MNPRARSGAGGSARVLILRRMWNMCRRHSAAVQAAGVCIVPGEVVKMVIEVFEGAASRVCAPWAFCGIGGPRTADPVAPGLSGGMGLVCGAAARISAVFGGIMRGKGGDLNARHDAPFILTSLFPCRQALRRAAAQLAKRNARSMATAAATRATRNMTVSPIAARYVSEKHSWFLAHAWWGGGGGMVWGPWRDRRCFFRKRQCMCARAEAALVCLQCRCRRCNPQLPDLVGPEG